MKKYIAMVLALILVFVMTLAGCGKTEPEKELEPAVAPAEVVATATEIEPVAEVETEVTWDELVGEWYLKTLYYTPMEGEDGTVDPGFWDAAEQNVDARITIYESQGIDYLWTTKYSVDEDFEDMPFDIVQEPVAEGEDYMNWCIVSQPYDYQTMRIALIDENTLVCYERYLDESIGLDSTHKAVYTKEGPIQFHKTELSYSDILGTWYQYDYEVDGDSGLCSDSGMDCWITFYDDMTADYYSGNINYPEDAVKYEGCAVTLAKNVPVMEWIGDDNYPDRQDWSVYVDIPFSDFSDSETYQFGFTDDYTLTMYLEIVADGGSYHVGSVGNFGYYSPYEGQGYASVIPQSIQNLLDVAGDNQWVVALTNPSEEIASALDYEEWPVSDCTGYYEWDNAGELVLAPVDLPMEFEIYTGTPVYDSNGNFSYWEKEDFMYDGFLYPGQLWRGIVDLPENQDDATLCLFMGFGEMGLDGGNEYYVRLCPFDAEDPYLYFE